MEQDNNPRVPPPSSKNAKQVQNASFFKRYWWIFLIIGFVVLFGLSGWYVVSKVRHTIKRYEGLTRHVDTTYKEVDTIYKELDTTYLEAYDPSVKTAKLMIHGGAASYRLSEITDQLFSADAELHSARYELKSYNKDARHVVDFDMKNKNNRHHSWAVDNKSDSITFKLNAAPLWDIDITTGAAEMNFDLSKFKIQAIALKVGAGDLVLKMGEPLANSDIRLVSGISDVTINIPRDAACIIESSSSLSSNDFEGFTKKDDGHYETANFSAAKNKYHIHITGGVSDYKVHLY